MKTDANYAYGISHTRFYKPSVVSELRFDRDENGRVEHIHSDVYFLKRQEDLQRKIGLETVRQYINNMVVKGEVSQIPSDLSDDQLFALIPNKELNNMTTAYQMARHLERNHNEVKGNYDKVVKDTKRYTSWLKSRGAKEDE